MKKILFVNSSLTGGGSQKVMVLIANELCNRNYDVDMFLFSDLKEISYVPNKKINIIRCNIKSRVSILKKIKKMCFLRKNMKTGKYDAIVSFMQPMNVITLLSALGLHKNIIISERANPKMQKNLLLNIASKCLYSKAKYLVLQTEKVKDMFEKRMQRKCVVIPNPVDEKIPDFFNGIRKKKIVAVGRLTEQKNFEMLIRVFAQIHMIYQEYKLEIYGVGPLLNNLTKLSNDLNISDCVRFCGYVDDVDHKIRDASIYVSTSNYEGISNSMIEALAMGIPTICTDCPVGGASLMIKSNENGILVSVGDEKELYNSIKKIISDEKFAKKISKNALNVRSDFSIVKIVDKWENLI